MRCRANPLVFVFVVLFFAWAVSSGCFSCVLKQLDGRWCVGMHVKYHWPELPQVSFLSRHNTPSVTAKVYLLRQTHNTSLSWQKYACRDKTFVVTNTCLSWWIFDLTKIFCRDKHAFVAAKVFSRQAYLCHDKRCVSCLWWQKWYLWHLLPMVVKQWAQQDNKSEQETSMGSLWR